MNDTIGVQGLKIDFVLPDRKVQVLKDLTITFSPNKVTGIIGESGSGKSVLGMAMLGILPPYAEVQGGFFFEERTFAYRSDMQKALLGRELGFIPQNPQEAMNPSRKIRKQLYEALSVKYKNRDQIREKAQSVLQNMGFNDPKKILDSYPYELSGGMQQRALSAISVCCEPKWIIADEPTKGLDKELCDQVAENFLKLQQLGVEGMIVITHDIDLAEKICDEILVMYGGKVLERGSRVIRDPRHPYTKALIESMPERKLEPIQDADREVGQGCLFAPRCSRRMPVCMTERPPLVHFEEGSVECFLYG